jgi:hypothetical protein
LRGGTIKVFRRGTVTVNQENVDEVRKPEQKVLQQFEVFNSLITPR